MIDTNKKYRTRDGNVVRIYATDGVEPYTVHGAIKWEIGWKTGSWTADGKYSNTVIDRHLDLIEIKPRIKETVWINIYDCYKSISHSEKAAEDRADCGIRARVKVDIDVEEGHGL
jgi:hypothetical protein